MADYTWPAQVAQVVQEYLARNPRGFQILVNNTGGPAGGRLLAATAAEFRAAFEQYVSSRA